MSLTVPPTAPSNWAELNERSAHGITVRLLHNTAENALRVEARDSKFPELDVDISVLPGDAVQAFKHPWVYAERSDVVAVFPGIVGALEAAPRYQPPKEEDEALGQDRY